ncbi:hypothetical protein S7S_16460 [Isoalcanivorax pacificus W11-5]|uniref:DUF2442 domain-containing protein n=1 Tax=Isoalcanivorax pacificus W11-5 TaxID=391936 RepID=A0A0B4XMT1_9GAMM|nr:DUF2442 domain-containing protein [Isoalcanivorax pacificus]AJD49704.1 hypothetical protein S7S_16460 [Isoalcanivorax pacificus W11-5]
MSSHQNAYAQNIQCTEYDLLVDLQDGRRLSIPLSWFPRLQTATPSQRENYVLMGGGLGVHWPELDEDISVEGLLRGQKVSQ